MILHRIDDKNYARIIAYLDQLVMGAKGEDRVENIRVLNALLSVTEMQVAVLPSSVTIGYLKSTYPIRDELDAWERLFDTVSKEFHAMFKHEYAYGLLAEIRYCSNLESAINT